MAALESEVALRCQGVLDIGGRVVDAVGEPWVQALDGRVIARVQHRDPGGSGLGIGIALLPERVGVTRRSVRPAVVIGLAGQDVVGPDVRHRIAVLVPPKPQHQLGDVHPGGHQERGDRQAGLGEGGGELLVRSGVLPAQGLDHIEGPGPLDLEQDLAGPVQEPRSLEHVVPAVEVFLPPAIEHDDLPPSRDPSTDKERRRPALIHGARRAFQGTGVT